MRHLKRHQFYRHRIVLLGKTKSDRTIIMVETTTLKEFGSLHQWKQFYLPGEQQEQKKSQR